MNNFNPNEKELETELLFLQLVERKKSQILADLLEIRKETDIPFEYFDQYDSFLQDTFDCPDIRFRAKDKEGDIIITYSRTFNLDNNKPLYYLIYFLERPNADEEQKLLEIILAFPTYDLSIMKLFE